MDLVDRRYQLGRIFLCVLSYLEDLAGLVDRLDKHLDRWLQSFLNRQLLLHLVDLEDLVDQLDQIHHRHLADLVDHRYRMDLEGLGGLFLVLLANLQHLDYLVVLEHHRDLADLVFLILHQHLVDPVVLGDLVLLEVHLDPVDLDLHLNHHYQGRHQLLLDPENRLHLEVLGDLEDSHKLDLELVRAF